MSQLSVADQHEVDNLNDDIRRLTQENKEAFSTRMRLEAEKNKLENLLTNNLMRRKDELMQVQYRTAFTYRIYLCVGHPCV
jgi:structural maintenance of chromosome 3 (chondroitin sulfate proteoglycan 6)